MDKKGLPCHRIGSSYSSSIWSPGISWILSFISNHYRALAAFKEWISAFVWYIHALSPRTKIPD
jgi:hypothetical protein